MHGKAFVFMNYKQALRLGHVGWGFMLEDGSYCFGSTDHLFRNSWWNLVALAKYSYVPAGGDIDFWSSQGTEEEMLQAMATGRGHHIRYHAYKVIDIPSADPEKALAEVDRISCNGWAVFHNNCIRHISSVLVAYGAGDELPDPCSPMIRRVPRKWFWDIDGPAIDLARSSSVAVS